MNLKEFLANIGFTLWNAWLRKNSWFLEIFGNFWNTVFQDKDVLNFVSISPSFDPPEKLRLKCPIIFNGCWLCANYDDQDLRRSKMSHRRCCFLSQQLLFEVHTTTRPHRHLRISPRFFPIYGESWITFVEMSLLNKKKKSFIGVPAPLGYVPGLGRGFVFENNFWIRVLKESKDVTHFMPLK